VNQSHAATRITIRPQDSSTGEEIEKEEVGMGYDGGRAEGADIDAQRHGYC